MGGVLRYEFFGYTNLGTGGSGKVAMSERIQEAGGEAAGGPEAGGSAISAES